MANSQIMQTLLPNDTLSLADSGHWAQALSKPRAHMLRRTLRYESIFHTNHLIPKPDSCGRLDNLQEFSGDSLADIDVQAKRSIAMQRSSGSPPRAP